MSFNFIPISLIDIILNSVEQILVSSKTSVAPPKHSAQSSNSSFLPPAPTVSSSHACINCEPVITATHKDMSEEEEEESDEDETGDDDSDSEEKDVPALQFGPPKGHQVKSDCLVEGNILF